MSKGTEGMAKKRISEELLETIKMYLNKIGEYYRIDAAYLFGSYAKGTQHADSDIDIAIVSKDISNRINDRIQMMNLTWKISVDIEPHPYNTKNFRQDEYMLVGEILRTGIRVA